MAHRPRAPDQIRQRGPHTDMLQQRQPSPEGHGHRLRRGRNKHNFWETSKAEMKAKMDKFNKIWD